MVRILAVFDNKLMNVVSELKKSELGKNLLIIGSSVNSKDFKDIDLYFYSESIWSPNRLLNLMCILRNIEKENKLVSFAFSSGSSSNKNAKYQLSITTGSKHERDEILEYSISLNNKLLFGKNMFRKYSRPGGEFFLPILIRQRNSSYSNYKKLKQYLFIGLLWLGIFEKKENQLKRFDKEYGTNIFEGYNDMQEFLDNSKDIKNGFNELEKVILERIKKDDPNSFSKKIRVWTEYEKFYFDIIKNLRLMVEQDKFENILRYLKEKQEEFESKFPEMNL
jgi:hypothetical protein